MANSCFFVMRAAGIEKDISVFLARLKNSIDFEIDQSKTVRSREDPSIVAIEGQGNCDWSIKLSLLDNAGISFLKDSARLNLVIEAFSSEPGFAFQEHYLIDRGNILIEDVADYEEHLVEGASDASICKLLQEKNLTREELMAAVNVNGDFCVGGFDNFGCFMDLIDRYRNSILRDGVQPSQNNSFEDKIRDAELRSTKLTANAKNASDRTF